MTMYDHVLKFLYDNMLFVLIWMHFVADFVCQTSYMALGKSKSWKPLIIHIGVYTAPFFLFGAKFAIINGLAHALVDYNTSRFNARMWELGTQGKPIGFRMFWIGVGFDQAVHMTVLLWTAKYFLYAF